MVLVVDHDVGNFRVFQQRLQGAEAEDLVQQIRLDLFLFVEAERNPAVADDLVNDALDRLPSLTGVDARKLFQVTLRQQRAVYFCLEVFQIH
jgi:hypothetical protein